MECKYIEIGGKVNDMFRRKIIIEASNQDTAINKYNFTDTYTTVYRYDNKQQDMANIIGDLYLDLDINDLEADFEKLRRDVLLLSRRLKTLFSITDNEIQYFFSGSKGFHILIPYETFGLIPIKNLNELYKMIAVELKSYTITKSVDTRIYDTKRLFRVPNTINTKTNLYKVQMTIEQIREIKYEELIEYAASPKDLIAVNRQYNEKASKAFNELIDTIRERQKKTINHKVARQMLENKEILPCVKYIIQNGAQKGGRNNTLMALASALFQRTPEDINGIKDIIHLWNNQKLDDPLSEREIETTIMSAYRNVQSGRRYGCAAFIDMGICVKGCPVRKLK